MISSLIRLRQQHGRSVIPGCLMLQYKISTRPGLSRLVMMCYALTRCQNFEFVRFVLRMLCSFCVRPVATV